MLGSNYSSKFSPWLANGSLSAKTIYWSIKKYEKEILHRNAGLPNEFGEYDQTPELMSEQIKEFMEENMVNIIGGCCGTTPDHITQIVSLAAQFEPRKF